MYLMKCVSWKWQENCTNKLIKKKITRRMPVRINIAKLLLKYCLDQSVLSEHVWLYSPVYQYHNICPSSQDKIHTLDSSNKVAINTFNASSEYPSWPLRARRHELFVLLYVSLNRLDIFTVKKNSHDCRWACTFAYISGWWQWIISRPKIPSYSQCSVSLKATKVGLAECASSKGQTQSGRSRHS